MKVKLKQPRKTWVDHGWTWLKTAPPFAVNPRGVLVHRVKSASKIRDRDKITPHYWCGNASYSGPVDLVEVPPKDRLLCHACEANAVANGELPASKLAGRHVHTGRLVPKRTCCNDNRN